jgi:hypothetical protein
MNTLVDTIQSARYLDGVIAISLNSGAELSFPIAANQRLKSGSAAELNNIEISPFGLHWPDLDEDLSLRGIQEGRFGRLSYKVPTSA